MSTMPNEDTANPESLGATVARGWNRFWFSPADPTPLGLVRICAGLVILYLHISYSLDLQQFFGANAWISLSDLNDFRENAPWQNRPWTEPKYGWQETPEHGPYMATTDAEKKYMLKWEGLSPTYTHARGYYSWSIWYHVTDPTWMRIIHGAHLLIFFFLMIGFCTRVTSVLAWLSALSYIQRGPTTLFGIDTIMNLALIYLMIGPSGAALSVDRLILRYYRTWRVLRARASSRKGGSTLSLASESLEFERPAPSISANLALRLLQVHICVVYFISGITKLQGNAWWAGTATWATVANFEFSPIHYDVFARYLRYLCQHRWLWEITMTLGVVGTLVFEIGFPALIWNHWMRWTMLISAVLMHTAIAIFMSLTTFSMMMLSVVTSFIPTESINRFVEWLTRGPGGMRLVFAAKTRGQVRAASLIHAADIWDQIRLADPAAEAETLRMQLHMPTSEIHTGYELFEQVTRSLRLLWPVAIVTWVPGARTIGQTWFPSDTNRGNGIALGGANRSKSEKVTG